MSKKYAKKDYNNFDLDLKKNLSVSVTIYNKSNNINNQNNQNNQFKESKRKKSKNYNVQNKKRKITLNHNKPKKAKRSKSEEKHFNIFEQESEEDENVKEIEYTSFMLDAKKTKKCFDKNDEFVSFSEMMKHKENYFEKNIKNLIKDSEKIHTYEVLNLKNENLKNIEFDSLINPKKNYEENKERLKLGAYKYIFNFKNIFLSKYEFSFDNSKIKKLDIFVDNPDDIDINYFSKNNQIFLAYKKKNIKSMILNTQEDIQRPIEEIKIDNDKDIYGSISKINQRWLNKRKCTKKINLPNIDSHKIYFNFKNSLEIPSIEKVFQEFVKQKIKIYENDIDKNKKPNINFINIPFITEIIYSFREDKIKLGKINQDEKIFIKDSIKEINEIYNKKYLFNMNPKTQMLAKYNKNIFLLDNMNIVDNYEKSKKWKNERIIKKNRYIYSGNASITLMKNTLSNNKYDNPNTSHLHNLSLQLNELNNKSNNDSINLNLSKFKSNDNNYSKCAKKLKEEIDLSLSNKNMFNSMQGGFNKFKSENLTLKKKLSSANSQKSENKEKNKEYNNLIKKISKAEDEFSKKRKKIYVNKIKQQQDIEFEKEIKKERTFKIIFPILLFLLPAFYSFYNRYWIE